MEAELDINLSLIIENLPYHKQIEDGLGIHIEKKVPYLIITRSAKRRERKIIANESSFIWSGENTDATELIKEYAKSMADEFGAFLLLEFWVNDKNYNTFRIMYPEGKAPGTIEKFEEGLLEYKKYFPHLNIERDSVAERCPELLEDLFSKQECKKMGILKIGLEIPNFFSDPKTGGELPVFFRTFRKSFSTTLKKGIYEFVRVQTNLGLSNYQLLGRQILNKDVWEVDKALAEIESTFEFLMLIAPANSDESWQEFKDSKYNENPTFHYRLLPVDPEKLKQKLYQIDIDVVDDPSIAFLFREKRKELDTLITMLSERNSKEFMLSSIRLFKSIDEPLLQMSREILAKVFQEPDPSFERVDGEYFIAAARQEIEYYKQQDPLLSTEIEIRDDMVGIMVSKGRLYIGNNFQIAKDRTQPLIQHEVGTHVLTYFNGSKQPLHLLRSGLAGYDELQEGIAVLSEYLVGGLTANRMRILAARVTAANDMVEGAEFKDVFNDLVNNNKFHPSTAYELTTRIFQSGGYTKDIIYLRGLVRLMRYLENDGDLDLLFAGKMSDTHIPIIKELKDRQVLKPIALKPRYMLEQSCLQRLDKVRKGISLADLIK